MYQNNDNESDTSAPFIAEELNAVLVEICSKSHIMNLQKCNNVLEEVQKLFINNYKNHNRDQRQTNPRFN